MSRDPRTVLVLAYEFPPTGGGGVQRVAKFARYLPEAGWTPVVVAGAVDPSRPSDTTLLDGLEGLKVARVGAFDPRRAVARLLGPLRRGRRDARATGGEASVPSSSGAPLSTRVSSWVSIPDHAAFWIGPAVRAAVALGREAQVEAVFASGPPHSVLVAGVRTAAALGVPLVADLRDAWRDNVGLRYPTRFHRARASALERYVMGTAAVVTCVSEPIAEEARQMGAKNVVVLPNGFDRADVPAWKPEPGDLRIAFMGQMYPAVSDPAPLLEGLALAGASSPVAAAVTFDVVGTEMAFARQEVADRRLDGRVRFLGYRPHAEALRLVATADAGVVLVRDAPGAQAVYTGKLFEYLGMGIPILLVGPVDGVAAELVREAGAGRVVAWEDAPGCARALVELAEAKARGERPPAPDPDVVRRFDRREQASVLASVLDRVTAR